MTNLKTKISKRNPGKISVPRTYKPDDMGLEEWQRALRKQFGIQQRFILKNNGNHPVFSDFLLTNPGTGKTYKLAIRGSEPGDNYCSCPDFSINNLGTCKHIEYALFKLMKKRGAKKAFRDAYIPPYSEIFLRYGLRREVKFREGNGIPSDVLELVGKYFDENGTLKDNQVVHFHEFLNSLPHNNDHEIRCYDDVLAYIAEHQDTEHRKKICEAAIRKGAESLLFKNVLKTTLYPYQREGALFAVKAGRCLIGDDMGLGKTIQALAAAEIMANLFNIEKALVVSPTSLKYQWKAEIENFTGRTVEVIEGFNRQREQIYRKDSFYKLVNYELVFRDIDFIREWAPDLIILDEAQRIKNWKTRTAKYIKQMESPFAMVLTGTPIENRIEELHSIMEFIDRRRLGPLYRFVHHHRITDGAGKVIGYRDLQSVRASLKDVMIRRKKQEVLGQLPGRIDKNFFVPMTKEQWAIHDENYEIVVKLVAKWRKYRFLSEADHRRLQIALNFMRMAADNTYLVDKNTVHGPKIEELEELLREVVVEGGEKALVFSQWVRMTELVEHILQRNRIGYVYLNGSIPSKKRKGLMSQFRDDPACRVFLSTDAGGVGLNLQSGSFVINLDIPWNPAVLEQRIGRAHRLGQHKTVRVMNFISSASIEEKILDLLKFKRSLSTGALDQDGDDIVMLGESQMKRFMQSVETLTENLHKFDPEIELRKQQEEEQDSKAADEKERAFDEGMSSLIAMNNMESLNTLLVSGAHFLMNLSKALTQSESEKQSPEKKVDSILGRDEKTGKAYLKIPLPDTSVLNNILSTLSKVVTETFSQNAR